VSFGVICPALFFVLRGSTFFWPLCFKFNFGCRRGGLAGISFSSITSILTTLRGARLISAVHEHLYRIHLATTKKNATSATTPMAPASTIMLLSLKPVIK
jgi:hypothetical protein